MPQNGLTLVWAHLNTAASRRLSLSSFGGEGWGEEAVTPESIRLRLPVRLCPSPRPSPRASLAGRGRSPRWQCQDGLPASPTPPESALHALAACPVTQVPGGFGMALVWLWCGLRVALEWLWVPNRLPSSWLWGGSGFRMRCLPTGFEVAYRWLGVALPAHYRKRENSGWYGGACGHPDNRPGRTGWWAGHRARPRGFAESSGPAQERRLNLKGAVR
jgi:hypothetical protein